MIDFFRRADWLNSGRLRGYAAILMVLSLLVVGYDARSHLAKGVMDAAGEHLGRDFVNTWAGARLAAEGRTPIAYDRAAFTAYERSLVGPLSEPESYTYPPVTMLLTSPLACFGYIPALGLWLGLGTLATVLLAARKIGAWFATCVCLGSPAVVVNALTGQNGQVTAALLVAGVVTLDSAPIASGILFGLVSYKPQMGLLIPIALAAGGRWRAFAGAAATVSVLVVASLVLFGPETWEAFFRQAADLRIGMQNNAAWWHRMPTVFAAARLLGLSVVAAYTVQAAAAVLAAVATAVVWRSASRTSLKGAALLVATFLVTPYALDYDTVVLVFAVILVAENPTEGDWLPWEKITYAALVLLPFFTVVAAGPLRLQVGPLAIGGALVFILRRAIHGVRIPHGRPAVALG
jgi:hypothetical protein